MLGIAGSIMVQGLRVNFSDHRRVYIPDQAKPSRRKLSVGHANELCLATACRPHVEILTVQAEPTKTNTLDRYPKH